VNINSEEEALGKSISYAIHWTLLTCQFTGDHPPVFKIPSKCYHPPSYTWDIILLILEFIPNKNLYYFFEQAHNNHSFDFSTSEQATLHHLITSMMCDMVATCHNQQVSIKSRLNHVAWWHQFVIKLTNFRLSAANVKLSNICKLLQYEFFDLQMCW
jgi:hypothetical protein